MLPLNSMNLTHSIKTFPSQNEARDVAVRLEAEGISCRVATDSAGLFATLYVDASDSERALQIAGDAGVDLNPLPGEVPEVSVQVSKGRIAVSCECGKALKVPVFRAGGSVTCPACRRSISVPSVSVGVTALPSVHRDEDEAMIEEVQAELHRLGSDKQRSIGKSIGTLVISVILFVSLGLFRSSVSGIALIVGVILIHELGHFIGMKLLKYKDVQMFFIPLFGAAVSGIETSPSGGKKALVSLLGPVPGILIGIGTGIAYFVTRQSILADATRTFLFLNTFNLLPFHPLDGGRLFDAVLFSRHPRIEVGFKILTTLVLGWLAFTFKDGFLGFFAFIIFMSLRGTQISASIAHVIRKEISDAVDRSSGEVPAEQVRRIVGLLKERLPAQHWKPSLLAAYVAGIWQRVRNRPCSIGGTIAVLFCYGFCFALGVVSAIFFEAGVYVVTEADKERIEQSGVVIPQQGVIPADAPDWLIKDARKRARLRGDDAE